MENEQESIEVRVEKFQNKMDKTQLRGMPYIGSVQSYDDPKDCAFGDLIERKCGMCFYRAFSENKDGDCHILPGEGKKTPKEMFGIPKDEIMPMQIDDKEVGVYCPYFTDFRAE